LALLAGGCGSSGGSRTTTTPLTSLPVSTTSPPPGPTQLQSIVVQADDLPAGWVARPAAVPADANAAAAAFAQCVGVPNTTGDKVAVTYAPDFVKGTTYISSTASSFKSPVDVQGDTSGLTNAKASDCFLQEIKSRLTAVAPKGVAVKSATLKITPGTGGGPANVVATATGSITFTNAGKTSTLNEYLVFFIAPRIEAHVDFFSVGSAIPASVRTAVLNKVSARVQNGS
jgi:hypothetical protein